MKEKKQRGDAVLKTMGDGLQEQFYQQLRATSQKKALAWLLEVHGIQSSPSAATLFWEWYPRQWVLRRAVRTSDNLESTLKKMPELKVTADQARSVAQVSFEIQAAEDRDPVLFASLRKGELEKERLRLEREKFEHAKKEDWEKGLDALYDAVKDCPPALDHFEAMKSALKEARG